MSKFTAQLAGPTEPATVNLSTNTGSAATDAVAALSFGLGVYNQYQQKQAVISQQNTASQINLATDRILQAFEEDINAGVSETKQEHNILKNSRRLAKELGVDPLAIRAQVDKFRNKSTASALEDADAAERKAVQQREQDRLDAETTLSTLAGFLPPSLQELDIKSLSDEDLRKRILQANEHESKERATQIHLDIQRSQATNAKEERRIDVRKFENAFLTQKGNQVGGLFLDRIKKIDRTDPTQVKSLIQEIGEDRARLSEVIRADANEQGLTLSQEEVTKIATEMTSKFDNLVRVLNRSDVASLPDTFLQEAIDTSMMNTLRTGSQQEKTAVAMSVIGKKVGLPPSLGNFNSIVNKAVQDSMMGNVSTALSTIKQDPNMTPNQKQESVRYLNRTLSSMFSPSVDYKEDESLLLVDFAQSVFAGSKRAKQEAAESGTMDAVIQGISTSTALENVPPEEIEELRETVAPEINKVLASKISAFVRSRQDVQIGFGGSLGAPETAEKAFNINPDTLVLQPTGVLSKTTKDARALNSSIQSGLKALEKMNASEEEIQAYKDDVLMAFGMVRTQ